MIQNLFTYLAIGTILMFTIDVVSATYIKESGFTFSNKQRIASILLWPVLVLGLILGLIKNR
jgi:hypothetical protein